ncbi:N-acetylglucosaminyl-phosphatidylinositol de-N-acetylase [Corythoichthys intestinalis]|uniref:N-acetylglucosaminyl-phosphatidylinositol de-N-acetylase n=1 Tax=Corythoichthys intestinalis TaxID=161448 RepID=UPI0025A54676|nr:N-acetylglucosaminyl-phosphatidylinositol de-N-acetylase [Corythoichthys intestinalis]XP_061800937.1 N-acetylglucosaminyl-phosphatidylinositol de-N-acetylase-like [Nerophis lumbriciformis]
MYLWFVVIVVLAYVICLKYIYYRHRRSFKNEINYLLSLEAHGAGRECLIVTAHPDDECMFFGPTIIRLIECNVIVHLLCLSEGNYCNQGVQRKQELFNSCAKLGIHPSRITILDHKKLPDDPKAEWRVSLLNSIIAKHLRAHSINMVLTFDGRGVSGHSNHIAIYKAVRHLATTDQLPKDCCLFSLVSVGLLRKYVSFLELPLSWLLPSSLCCIIGSKGYKQCKAAMLCHRTQLVWFRYLYITFSRYMFVNTFQMIPQGPKVEKMY